MTRPLLALTVAATVCLTGCSVLPAGADPAPTPTGPVTPTPSTTTPQIAQDAWATAPPAVPTTPTPDDTPATDTAPTPDRASSPTDLSAAPLRAFGRTISTPEGLDITVDEPLGYRPGQPNPDPDLFTSRKMRLGRDLTAVRLRIVNRSSAPISVESVFFAAAKNGEAVPAVVHEEEDGADLTDDVALPPGGELTVTAVTPTSADGRWLVAVGDQDAGSEEERYLGVFAGSDVVSRSTTTMRLGRGLDGLESGTETRLLRPRR